MAEESETRFETIMSRLFHVPPKPKPDSITTRHGVQTLSGRKRLHSSPVGTKLAGTALGESGSLLLGSTMSAQASLCRPWDRSDLFRRLSTFKSMTWFAKPQVVSPLECARRGWVNVDMDTIACTACGARILFSTPSAWTQQQVEKAAMVCSLKLENGHKLLCPWINNVCLEELAQFPIMPQDDLIEDYKQRLFSLSQLIALPVILPAIIDNLESSQLGQFLRESSTSGCNMPLEKQSELPGKLHESVSSISYYQAKKLISLFGWEPHMLPYKVDFKDGQNQSFKDANVVVTTGEKQKVSIYSLCDSEGTKSSSELQFDPSSVVLDCKLCGASVGLWAFFTTPRPLEYLRFVGLTVVNGKNISNHEVSVQEGSSSNQMYIGNMEGITNTVTTGSTSLGFTIAGGPPPAMLNYGATISLPIIGQNLRERFAKESENKDHLAIQKFSQIEEDQQMLLESENDTAEGTSATPGADFVAKNPLDLPQTVADGSTVDENLTETGGMVNSTVADHHRFDAEEYCCSTPEDYIPFTKDGGSEFNRQAMTVAQNHEQGSSHPSNRPNNPGIGSLVKHEPVPFSLREDRKLPSFSKPTEFDPIKQHRHFCPWISSAGNFAPGWQLTLTALEGNKELKNAPLSTLIEEFIDLGKLKEQHLSSMCIIENLSLSLSLAAYGWKANFRIPLDKLENVDDPVASVKNLFATSSEKRKRRKVAAGS